MTIDTYLVSSGDPRRAGGPDSVLDHEVRTHGLDAVDLNEAGVEAEVVRAGGVAMPAAMVVEHGIEGA